MGGVRSDVLTAVGMALCLGACGGGGTEDCPSTQPLRCDDVCVDPASDHQHCGGCDNACASNQQCQGGACQELCDVELTYYQDSDGDLYGNPDATQVGCSPPAGYVTDATDCDDSQRLVNPNAVEACNGTDDDCDGNTDEGCDCIAGDTKDCGDDTGACTFGTQTCNDAGIWGSCQGGTWPTVETCDGTDQDCDGQTDEGLAQDNYEGNDTCASARALAEAVEAAGPPENAGAMSLYASDLQTDVDWYTIAATETGHLCLGDPQCFWLDLTFTPPAGADYADYQVCVRNYGSTTCDESPDEETCTSLTDWDVGLGAYHLQVSWDGRCGLNDDRTFHVAVTRAADTASSCAPYQLSYELVYGGLAKCGDLQP